MAAKRRNRRQRFSEDADDDDGTSPNQLDLPSSACSITSETVSGDPLGSRGRSAGRGINLQHWDDRLDSLCRSRPGRRLVDLTWFQRVLTTSYAPELVADSFEAICPVLASSVEKGGTEEAMVACSCLASMLITLGETALGPGEYEATENWLFAAAGEIDFDDALPDFAEPEAGPYHGAFASSEIGADESLSLACGQAEGILKGLTLLATRWRTLTLAEWDDGSAAGLLNFASRCIRCDSPSLRMTSGYAFALLLEGKWAVSEAGSRFGVVPSVLAELESKYWDMMDALRDLCNGRGRVQEGLSREERKEQKALFRTFLRTAETGEGPSETISIGDRSNTTDFKSWVAYIRYSSFREVLKGALSSHLAGNEFLITSINGLDRRDSDLSHTVHNDLTTRSAADLSKRKADQKFAKSQRRQKQKFKEEQLQEFWD